MFLFCPYGEWKEFQLQLLCADILQVDGGAYFFELSKVQVRTLLIHLMKP